MREEGQMKTRRKEGNKKEMEGGETRKHINKRRRISELYIRYTERGKHIVIIFLSLQSNCSLPASNAGISSPVKRIVLPPHNPLHRLALEDKEMI